MTGLFALDTLVERLRLYVAGRDLKPEAFALLEQTLNATSCRAATRIASPASENAPPAICSAAW
jgi:hypothetical protein